MHDTLGERFLALSFMSFTVGAVTAGVVEPAYAWHAIGFGTLIAVTLAIYGWGLVADRIGSAAFLGFLAFCCSLFLGMGIVGIGVVYAPKMLLAGIPLAIGAAFVAIRPTSVEGDVEKRATGPGARAPGRA